MTGNQLKEKRLSLELRQEDLARELEVVVSSVARWEQLKDEKIPNSKMLESTIGRIGLEKLKNYFKAASKRDLLSKIRFDFDSIPVWNGWLEVHFENDFYPIETLIDSERMKSEQVSLKDNSQELREIALNQFKIMLKLNNE